MYAVEWWVEACLGEKEFEYIQVFTIDEYLLYMSSFCFQNSMSEIAQLFTEFFRDLDVVPSDIVAGLVLLRHHQKHRMKTIISQVLSVAVKQVVCVLMFM